MIQTFIDIYCFSTTLKGWLVEMTSIIYCIFLGSVGILKTTNQFKKHPIVLVKKWSSCLWKSTLFFEVTLNPGLNFNPCILACRIHGQKKLLSPRDSHRSWGKLLVWGYDFQHVQLRLVVGARHFRSIDVHVANFHPKIDLWKYERDMSFILIFENMQLFKNPHVLFKKIF